MLNREKISLKTRMLIAGCMSALSSGFDSAPIGFVSGERKIYASPNRLSQKGKRKRAKWK